MTTSPLLTDLYQLTMAAAYHASGRAEQEANVRSLVMQKGVAVGASLKAPH